MDKRVKFYLFIQRKLRGEKIQKAVEMEYTIPPDYQSLILSVGYYSTVRIFGRTTSRKHTVDAYTHSPHSSFKINIKTIRFGSWLEDGVGQEGGPDKLALCNFRVVRRVETLWGDLFMSFYKNPLTLSHKPLMVSTHDRADQNPQCSPKPNP